MIDSVNGKILGVTNDITNFWYGLTISKDPFVILDILLVAIIIYWGYLLIKETRAMRILYGILLLGIIMTVGQIFKLLALNWLLGKLVTMILVAIPVVFQPELRSALERLGRTRFVGTYKHLGKKEIKEVVGGLVETAKILSKNKTGALIVLTQKTGLRDIINTGKYIGAKISPEILLTIFAPNTPLHDGATIISGNKIVAAGCTLPLSEDKFDFQIGTRHRAAVGISSQSDAIVIIVSEEKGTISISYNGQLSTDLTPKELEEFLISLLHSKSSQIKNKISKKRIRKL